MTDETKTGQQAGNGEPQDNSGITPTDNNLTNPENTGADAENPENAGAENNSPADDNNENDVYGKPETYDFSNVDIGENMELEPESTKEFMELAGRCNLNQKTADEFIKLGAGLVNKTISQIKEQQIESYKIALNTDKEIGGAKLNAALDEAELAYSQFATPELIKVFNETGLKYHPEVIKTFRNIGAMMKEGKIFNSDSPAETEQSYAEIIYGNK